MTKCNYIFISIMFVLIAVVLYSNMNYKEGYDNNVSIAPGLYPISDDLPLLNSYDYSGSSQVSNNNSSKIWQQYPSFGVSSYKQITNNLKYWNSPNNGTCTRAEFCGALYNNKQNISNVVVPLPPLNDTNGTRVNYYYAKNSIVT